MQLRAFLLVVAAAALISCGKTHDQARPGSDVDEAVIAVALKDFANWKEATFGDLEGVLELEPDSKADPDATAQGIRTLAPEIKGRLDDDVVGAFLERNRSSAPVAPLFAGSPWARLRQSTTREPFSFSPPDGAKAIGALTLPGYDSDGSRALVQIHHTWSIHSAVVTYVLSLQQGKWKVVARDQVVFL